MYGTAVEAHYCERLTYIKQLISDNNHASLWDVITNPCLSTSTVFDKNRRKNYNIVG